MAGGDGGERDVDLEEDLIGERVELHGWFLMVVGLYLRMMVSFSLYFDASIWFEISGRLLEMEKALDTKIASL